MLDIQAWAGWMNLVVIIRLKSGLNAHKGINTILFI